MKITICTNPEIILEIEQEKTAKVQSIVASADLTPGKTSTMDGVKWMGSH
jgi:hypothetical protein